MTTRGQHEIYKPNSKYSSQAFRVISSSPSLVPKNPISALRDPNWKFTMQVEHDALIEYDTWELVPHPFNANIIHSLWIFRHKTHSDGSFE